MRRPRRRFALADRLLLTAPALLLAPRAAASPEHAPASTAAASTSNQKRALVTVEGSPSMDANADDLDPDDFLWEKLPGRCCFYGGPDPLNPVKWLGAHTCDQCTVWDLPV